MGRLKKKHMGKNVNSGEGQVESQSPSQRSSASQNEARNAIMQLIGHTRKMTAENTTDNSDANKQLSNKSTAVGKLNLPDGLNDAYCQLLNSKIMNIADCSSAIQGWKNYKPSETEFPLVHQALTENDSTIIAIEHQIFFLKSRIADSFKRLNLPIDGRQVDPRDVSQKIVDRIDSLQKKKQHEKDTLNKWKLLDLKDKEVVKVLTGIFIKGTKKDVMNFEKNYLAGYVTGKHKKAEEEKPQFSNSPDIGQNLPLPKSLYDAIQFRLMIKKVTVTALTSSINGWERFEPTNNIDIAAVNKILSSDVETLSSFEHKVFAKKKTIAEVFKLVNTQSKCREVNKLDVAEKVIRRLEYLIEKRSHVEKVMTNWKMLDLRVEGIVELLSSVFLGGTKEDRTDFEDDRLPGYVINVQREGLDPVNKSQNVSKTEILEYSQGKVMNGNDVPSVDADMVTDTVRSGVRDNVVPRVKLVPKYSKSKNHIQKKEEAWIAQEPRDADMVTDTVSSEVRDKVVPRVKLVRNYSKSKNHNQENEEAWIAQEPRDADVVTDTVSSEVRDNVVPRVKLVRKYSKSKNHIQENEEAWIAQEPRDADMVTDTVSSGVRDNVVPRVKLVRKYSKSKNHIQENEEAWIAQEPRLFFTARTLCDVSFSINKAWEVAIKGIVLGESHQEEKDQEKDGKRSSIASVTSLATMMLSPSEIVLGAPKLLLDETYLGIVELFGNGEEHTENPEGASQTQNARKEMAVLSVSKPDSEEPLRDVVEVVTDNNNPMTMEQGHQDSASVTSPATMMRSPPKNVLGAPKSVSEETNLEDVDKFGGGGEHAENLEAGASQTQNARTEMAVLSVSKPDSEEPLRDVVEVVPDNNNPMTMEQGHQDSASVTSPATMMLSPPKSVLVAPKSVLEETNLEDVDQFGGGGEHTENLEAGASQTQDAGTEISVLTVSKPESVDPLRDVVEVVTDNNNSMTMGQGQQDSASVTSPATMMRSPPKNVLGAPKSVSEETNLEDVDQFGGGGEHAENLETGALQTQDARTEMAVPTESKPDSEDPLREVKEVVTDDVDLRTMEQGHQSSALKNSNGSVPLNDDVTAVQATEIHPKDNFIQDRHAEIDRIDITQVQESSKSRSSNHECEMTTKPVLYHSPAVWNKKAESTNVPNFDPSSYLPIKSYNVIMSWLKTKIVAISDLTDAQKQWQCFKPRHEAEASMVNQMLSLNSEAIVNFQCQLLLGKKMLNKYSTFDLQDNRIVQKLTEVFQSGSQESTFKFENFVSSSGGTNFVVAQDEASNGNDRSSAGFAADDIRNAEQRMFTHQGKKRKGNKHSKKKGNQANKQKVGNGGNGSESASQPSNSKDQNPDANSNYLKACEDGSREISGGQGESSSIAAVPKKIWKTSPFLSLGGIMLEVRGNQDRDWAELRDNSFNKYEKCVEKFANNFDVFEKSNRNFSLKTGQETAVHFLNKKIMGLREAEKNVANFDIDHELHNLDLHYNWGVIILEDEVETCKKLIRGDLRQRSNVFRSLRDRIGKLPLKTIMKICFLDSVHVNKNYVMMEHGFIKQQIMSKLKKGH